MDTMGLVSTISNLSLSASVVNTLSDNLCVYTISLVHFSSDLIQSTMLEPRLKLPMANVMSSSYRPIGKRKSLSGKEK